MRSERRRIGSTFALATLVLVVLLGVRPVSVQQLFAGYVLVLAGFALAALTRVARTAAESPPASEFERSLAPRPTEQLRPPELVRTEREITLGTSSAGHLHQRLIPLLREAATARLSANHNVELARRPAAARALLGEDAWDLLRPDRPQPLDHDDDGISMRRLRGVVATLEEL